MSKIMLNLDALKVESFETSTELDEIRGTVRGNSGPVSLFSPERTCADSCLDPNSCVGTCACTDGTDC